MILSEYQRRWDEIKFYYFCLDIYNIKKDMLDVAYMIEALAQIGNIQTGTLKRASGKILGDPYCMPINDEVMILASLMGFSIKEIAQMLGKARSTIDKALKKKKDNFSPIPRLAIDENNEIHKFLELLETLKKAGI